ncbi:MAG: hypothetical protein JWP01_935 [Myxococcales bacterium]|nr:hypothetical protein [Myxococcales bacterium]
MKPDTNRILDRRAGTLAATVQGLGEVGSTANQYEILAKLATGGMAEIFLARGASVASVERYVVLKRILRDRANDASFVQMFLQEARLAAQLNHPNVAQVFDIGKLGESYFFTMEYVHGETVRGLLHRARSLRREIPLACILTVIGGAAAGLHHAHDRLGLDGRPLGIVHRDVSPSNLMISYEGSVKVVDFGVAKAENRTHETKSGAVKGKISYLSPEQCRGAQLDRRSDLFSLGIVLWEMLTTERLYKRASDFENMDAIVNEPPPPPSTRRPGLPRELDEMSVRLLSKPADERYQSADELLEAIEALAARINAQLSPSALGRFMRELFGQRPEPWLEMEFRDAPEGVTVTNEPIPSEIAEPDAVELDLAHVRDLSRQLPAVGSDSSAVPPADDDPMSSQRWTSHGMANVRTDERRTVKVSATAVRTFPASGLAGRGVADLDGHPTLPIQKATVPLRTPPLGVGPVPLPATPGPASRPPQVGTAAASSIASSIPATPSVASQRRRASTHASQAPPTKAIAPQPEHRVAVIGAVAFVVVTVGVAAWYARSDRGTTTAADPPARGTGAIVDYAATAPAVDAAISNEAAPVDAAAVVVPAPPADAAVVVTTAPPTPSQRDQIAAAYAASRFADVVELCRASVGDSGPLCTVAACQRADVGRARTWLGRVSSSKRAAVIADCKAVGVDLPPRRPAAKPDPAPTPDCVADPMACQR